MAEFDPYVGTDWELKALDRALLAEVNRLAGLTSFDELNVVKSVKATYAKAERQARTTIIKAGRAAYKDTWKYMLAAGLAKPEDEPGDIRSAVPIAWVDELLSNYDPVTEYVYEHELERKQARLAEALLAALNAAARMTALKRARLMLAGMVSQYADEATHKATLKAMQDAGIRHVRWVTVMDERRCSVCRSRDGHIYTLGMAPPKPHWKCRCVLVPVD